MSSQAERLRALIEEEILSFQLKPGDKLDECGLAKRYGTSRTPVREALRQLSANGLVEIRPHKGAMVARLGIRELVELLEVMAELEGACRRLAAKSCLNSDIDAMAAAQEDCRRFAEAHDPKSYARANEVFHETIYAASRNNYLVKMTLGIRNRIGAYRRLQLDHINRILPSVMEHDRILRTIRDGLPDETDRLLQVHILNIGGELRRMIALISEGENAFPSRTQMMFDEADALHVLAGAGKR
ncbi:GntR family transcriptional regulator [Rhodomicrobium lacus]|uniref:GntR family transcriptional regulator n=1 Tax=Rhodomicrobium lacus TaxID=2498452 RepID=UPI000F8D8CED|nr:GntR family transcriptional regulator [Rhodomicrobium lacus]